MSISVGGAGEQNGDLVEGPVTIYRIAGKRAVVDRVVTASVEAPP